MKDVIKVSTVAFHAIWGDKEANLNKMKGYIEAAAAEGSNLVVFPEMAGTVIVYAVPSGRISTRTFFPGNCRINEKAWHLCSFRNAGAG